MIVKRLKPTWLVVGILSQGLQGAVARLAVMRTWLAIGVISVGSTAYGQFLPAVPYAPAPYVIPGLGTANGPVGLAEQQASQSRSSDRQGGTGNAQRYHRMLSSLEAAEQYRTRRLSIYLDHKEQLLETAARAYDIRKREEEYRSKGYLPPRPEQAFSYRGKTYKSYQEFKQTPEFQELGRNLALKRAVDDEITRRRQLASLAFERVYRSMGQTQLAARAAERAYAETLRDDTLLNGSPYVVGPRPYRPEYYRPPTYLVMPPTR